MSFHSRLFSGVIKVIGLGVILQISILTGSAQLFTPPEVSSFSELQAEMDARFTNQALSVMYPPGLSYTAHQGVFAFDSQFDTNLLAQLPAESHAGVELRHVRIGELSGFPISRTWTDGNGTVFTNTTVSGSYDPVIWVTSRFNPPDYLEGQDLDDWIAAHQLTRQTLSLELIATNDIAGYISSLTNMTGQTGGTYTTNDIATLLLQVAPDNLSMDIIIQVPTNVHTVGIYDTTNLVTPFPWHMVAEIPHTTDPVMFNYLLDGSYRFQIIANHQLDSDGDGLLDATETLQLGTQANSDDSDGDGLTDYNEIMVYLTNPLDNDSDGDNLTDAWEIENGFDPLDGTGAHGGAGDADGDGLSNQIEQGLGTDPNVPDSIEPLPYWSMYTRAKTRSTFRPIAGFKGFISYTNPTPNYYLTLVRDDIHHYEGKDSNCFHYADYKIKYDLTLTLEPKAMVLSGQGNEDFYDKDREPGQPWVTDLERHVAVTWTNFTGTETSYKIIEGNRCCDATNIFCGVGFTYSPTEYEHGLIPYHRLDFDDPEVTYSELSYLDTGGSDNSEPYCSDRTVRKSYVLSSPYTTNALITYTEEDLTELGSSRPWPSIPWAKHVDQYASGACPAFSVNTATISSAVSYRFYIDEVYFQDFYSELSETKYAFGAYDLEDQQVYHMDWVEYFDPAGTNVPSSVTGKYRAYFVGSSQEVVYLGDPDDESDPSLRDDYLHLEWEDDESDFLLHTPTREEGNGVRHLSIINLDLQPDPLVVSVTESQALVSVSYDSWWNHELGGNVQWSVTPSGMGNIVITTNVYGETEFNFCPSNSLPKVYTVRAELEKLPEFYDECKVTVIKVELDVDPGEILGVSAKTTWSDQEEVTTKAEISVQVTPSSVAGEVQDDISLEIKEIVGGVNYTAPGTGTLTQDLTNPLKWTYQAFNEPQTEKHPETLQAVIVPKYKGVECGDPLRINVKTVFNWFTTGIHQHGAGQPHHASTLQDYQKAYEFIRWKYSFLDSITVGGNTTGFNSWTIVLQSGVSCGFPPVSATACTTIFDDVTFGTTAFNNENVCASTVGHELVHTAGILNLSDECTAYTWEVDSASQTGLQGSDLSTAQSMQTTECP